MKNKEKKEEDVICEDIKFNKVEVDNNKILENIEGLKYSLDEMQNIENEIHFMTLLIFSKFFFQWGNGI